MRVGFCLFLTLGILGLFACTPTPRPASTPVVVTRCAVPAPDDNPYAGCAIWMASITREGSAEPVLILDKVLFEVGRLDMFAPELSPDGMMVLFVSGEEEQRDIFVVRTDGSDLRNITRSPEQDGAGHWSPDSKRVLFNAYREGRPRFLIADVENGTVSQVLTACSTIASPWAEWLPGNRIASTRVYDTNGDGQINRDDTYELYLTDLAECNPQRVTHNNYNEFYPTWSPDGRYVAFVVPRQPSDRSPLLTFTQINVLDMQTGEERSLFPFPNTGRLWIQHLAWDPTGQFLLLVVSDVAGSDKKYHLYLVSLEGGETQRVQAPEGWYSEADW